MKIAIVGHGRMGRAVETLAEAAGNTVVARLDLGDPISPDGLEAADVAVEFTTPEAAPQTP